MNNISRIVSRFKQAMSWSGALDTLGFKPGSSPSDDEVNKAYRQKLIDNRKIHPDHGGDADQMVQLNAAKDTLLGKLRPDRGDPGPRRPAEPSRPAEPPAPQPKETVVTFAEAATKANIPSGVEWLFVTDPAWSGYNSDEVENTANGWVACGKVGDKKWVIVGAEHHRYSSVSYFSMNQALAPEDIWSIRSHVLTTRQDIPDAAELFGGVTRAWKNFQYLKKAFNSKVTSAKGWTFSSRIPPGPSVTIKLLIANEFGGVFTGKTTIEIAYIEKANYGGSEVPTPSGFFKDDHMHPYQYLMTINGKSFTLSVADTERLSKLMVGGKRFSLRVFGDYPQHSRPKSLTRNRDGKILLEWMRDKLLDLPAWALDGVNAAIAQLGSKKATQALLARLG